MIPTDKIWMNGELIPWTDAKCHILTHALHYGSGVFEGIRCYHTKKGPAIFRLKEHIKRLYNSSKIYFMTIDNKIGDEKRSYTVDELCDATKETVRVNKDSLIAGNKKIMNTDDSKVECYIRPIVYRGYGEMGLNPLKSCIDFSIAVWPWGAYLGGGDTGIRVKISSFERINSNVLPPNAKATGQYINSILAGIEVKKAGYDEAILLDNRGFISEGPGENLFIIKDGKILTPPAHASILTGITRDSIITVAKELGYEVLETDIDRGMLYLSDEAFFTGTAAEVTAIREVDNYVIGNGKMGHVTRKIHDRFFEIIKKGDSGYEKWLDFV
ncbi:MAG: branched chain amino acid aminotransferase [Candidatus Altiarchaeales archaeon HGW-Altiarchaeales-3]|nr:MAG: branched chain amino acid aminotransferase [Candidatus Altiarchaeales archaeon HGW-Altiarchaeales-3]